MRPHSRAALFFRTAATSFDARRNCTHDSKEPPPGFALVAKKLRMSFTLPGSAGHPLSGPPKRMRRILAKDTSQSGIGAHVGLCDEASCKLFQAEVRQALAHYALMAISGVQGEMRNRGGADPGRGKKGADRVVRERYVAPFDLCQAGANIQNIVRVREPKIIINESVRLPEDYGLA